MKNRKNPLDEKELHTITACAAAIDRIIKKHNPKGLMPADRLKTIVKDVIAGQTVIAAATEPAPKFNMAGDCAVLAYTAYVNGDIEDALRNQMVAWDFEDAPELYRSIVLCNDDADVVMEDRGGEPEKSGIAEDLEDQPILTELEPDEDDDYLVDENEQDEEIPEDEAIEDFEDEEPDDGELSYEEEYENDEEPEEAEFPDADSDIDNTEDENSDNSTVPITDLDDVNYEDRLNNAVENVIASMHANLSDDTASQRTQNVEDASGNSSHANPIEDVEESEERAEENPGGSLVKGDPVMAALINTVKKMPKGKNYIMAANRLSVDGSEKGRERAKLFLRRLVNLS